MASAATAYAFAAPPRPVNPGRTKYRTEAVEEKPKPRNIMSDPRVVRGSTYAVQVLPASAEPDPSELQRQAEARRRARLRQKQAALEKPPRTPEPVEGRQHREIQTEIYLEEITDRVIEVEAEVQTDHFLDRPPSPLYVPIKTGVDDATQVYDGDLFHFDFEVQPILEVMVGKTLEQALLEVLEEEELEAMARHQAAFQARRDAELAETQRLEEAERRRFEEKERRLAQERARVAAEAEAAEKIAARAYAQQYLSDLMGSVFTSLSNTGFFYDTVERDVETGFLPFITEAAAARVDRLGLAKSLADSMIAQAIEKREQVYLAHLQAQREEAERRRLEAEAAAKAKADAEAAAEAKRKREEEERRLANDESDDMDDDTSANNPSSYDD